jgi:hypothetical protein
MCTINVLLISNSEVLLQANRIRKKKILAPLIIFIYCLIFKSGILDGWHGWYYTFQRALAELWLGIHTAFSALMRYKVES